MNNLETLPAACWHAYSKKMIARIENPRNAGFFSDQEASARAMRKVVGRGACPNQTNRLVLCLLVDEEDGVIVEAKFQAIGHSGLLAASDLICDFLIHKNYDQASKMSAAVIDKQLRDKPEQPVLSASIRFVLNIVLDAIEDAAAKCSDIPFTEIHISSPVNSEDFSTEDGVSYPGWLDLKVDLQMAVIEDVIANEIRPYIEMDAGGVKVLNVINSRELVIAYEGSCTTCYSATGATLNAIQQILRKKIHPEIVVVPDMQSLFIQE